MENQMCLILLSSRALAHCIPISVYVEMDVGVCADKDLERLSPNCILALRLPDYDNICIVLKLSIKVFPRPEETRHSPVRLQESSALTFRHQINAGSSVLTIHTTS